METYFAEIILPLSVPNTFTYRLPQNMAPFARVGMRVVVPIGRQKLHTGIIASLHGYPPKDYQAKYVDSLLDDKPVVTAEQIALWDWMSDYYMCFKGEVMLAALPIGMRLSSESIYLINPTFDGDTTAFGTKENTLIEVLSKREALSGNEISEVLGIKTIQPIIKKLLDEGAILIMEDLKERYLPKIETYVSLSPGCADEDGLEAAFKNLSRAPKQEEVLMMYVQMSNHYGDEFQDVKKILLQKKSGSDSSTINQLVRKGIFVLEEREVDRIPDTAKTSGATLDLSQLQDLAYKEIQEHFKTKEVVLLHGITASGKTEIYISLIKELLDKGQQVLYMLPEIALTTQMIQRLSRYFGSKVVVYHSRFNQHERVELYRKVLNDEGEGRLILGARSALFLPFRNLGLVIVDEEHEVSFKQFDPAPRYNARDSAIVLSAIHGAKTILGSATPSYESLFNAKSGKYGYVEMSERFGGIALPQIKPSLLSPKTAPSGYFTQELLDEIDKSLKLKEQVILFQNRRGYAPVLVCEMCGWSPECTRCDVTVTFHKSSQRLVCHYCGNRYTHPPTCPACGSHKLKLAGFGTERIEEELPVFFPEATIARLDLDSTRQKDAYLQILTDFQDGLIDILIGTQMVTKGLDFKKVNLVGILNADLLLKFPDFRSTERGFQLMTQVAGRAGRREKRGTVIIQTRDADQWIIHQVVQGNFAAVAEQELGDRKKFGYPPFTRLIMLTFRHKELELVDYTAAEYHKQLLGFLSPAQILGPEYPQVARVKNRYNKHIILKIPRNENPALVKTKLTALSNRFFMDKPFKAVRLIINVDPQ